MQLEALPEALGDRCFRCRSMLRFPAEEPEAVVRCVHCGSAQSWRANSNPAGRAVDALRDALGVPDRPQAVKAGIGERCAVEDCAAVAGPSGYCEACLALYPGLLAEGPEGKSLLASEHAEAKAELERAEHSSELPSPTGASQQGQPDESAKSENEALEARSPIAGQKTPNDSGVNTIEIDLRQAEKVFTHPKDRAPNLEGEPYPTEFEQIPLLFTVPLQNGQTLRVQVAMRLI